jgi:hypothetical protein
VIAAGGAVMWPRPGGTLVGSQRRAGKFSWFQLFTPRPAAVSFSGPPVGPWGWIGGIRAGAQWIWTGGTEE